MAEILQKVVKTKFLKKQFFFFLRQNDVILAKKRQNDVILTSKIKNRKKNSKWAEIFRLVVKYIEKRKKVKKNFPGVILTLLTSI